MIVTIKGRDLLIGEGCQMSVVVYPNYDVSEIGHCTYLWEDEYGFLMMHETGEVFYACDNLDTRRLRLMESKPFPILVLLSASDQLYKILTKVNPDTAVYTLAGDTSERKEA